MVRCSQSCLMNCDSRAPFTDAGLSYRIKCCLAW